MAAKVAVSAVLLALVASSSAFFGLNKPATTTGTPGAFKNLAVTLPDPTRPKTFGSWFNSLPQTEDDAKKAGWKALGSGCSSDNYFVGNRYLPPKDQSIALLFDSQGVVAGFQAIYDADKLIYGSEHNDCKTLDKYTNDYNFLNQPMIHIEVIQTEKDEEEKVCMVLTAYFNKPSEICNSQQDPDNVKENGFGTALYFQNGTKDQYFVAPPTRSEAAAQHWDNNKCLPLNGYHNFLYSSDWDAQNCTENIPNWSFYDENERLSGFGFSLPGCDDSPRFQHPPGAIVEYVSGSACAKRVANTVKFSNINVYLVPVKDTLDDCNKGTFDDIQKGFMDKVKQACNLNVITKLLCRTIGISY